MQYQQRLETHFPVQVLVRDHTGVEEINAGLHAAILTLEQRHRHTELDATRMGECTTQGGYQTSGRSNFLDGAEPHVRTLRDRVINPAIDAYLQDALCADPYAVRFTLFSWANILRAGHWQAPHMHPTEFNIISGVYYVHAPERPAPEGDLEFLNPHPISTLHGHESSRRHRPSTGQLLLFPPYYMHFVHPVRGGGERVVIGFDVRLVR